jgi:hypothetical protein
MSITLNNLKTAKTADLLAFYNAHRTPIVKFRDRATAESRVTALLQELASKTTSNATSTASSAQVSNPVIAAAVNASGPVIKKTYLGIIRDHSGSMGHITEPAARDYNATLTAAQAASKANNINTILSVIECGGGFRRKETLVPIESVSPMALHEYRAPGSDTPLFNSVEAMIQQFLALPDAQDPEVNFLIVATTDGQDNVTRDYGGRQLAAHIRQLQSTDRWTVVFRVPRGDGRSLAAKGIDAGNILEWETTKRGVEVMATQNVAAFNEFYSATKTGLRSTRTFYTSVANVTENDVKKLGDISSEVSLWPVSSKENEMQIRDFVESRLNGAAMLKGAAFYQLVKTEDKIQDYKLIAIRDKDSGQIYCGPEARDLIGLPRYGDARVRPDTAGKWQVFVQSTSVNRKVTGGTQLMYWPNVGKRFTEGKSAR